MQSCCITPKDDYMFKILLVSCEAQQDHLLDIYEWQN